MESEVDVYSIKQVSEILGIPTVTLRAWENRYKAVNPMRTDSGYRLYSKDHLEDLRWLKDQVENHHTPISQAVRMLKARQEEKNSLSIPEASDTGGADIAYQKMTEQIYEALYHYQGERANALIDFGFSLYGYDAMFYRVLVPVLVRVGDEWEKGRATVAQEHYMTSLVSQRFYQFFHLFPIHPDLPKALAFCPEGEHHQVGLMLFSLFMRKHGMEVLYLGANTPSEGVIQLLREQHVDMVCVSVSTTAQVPSCDELLEELAGEHPHIRFVLGGKGYENSSERRFPESVIGDSVEHWQQWMEQVVRHK